MSTLSSNTPHRDCAVQASSLTRLTLVADDAAACDTAHTRESVDGAVAPCGCSQDGQYNPMSLSQGQLCDQHPTKSSAARRHFAKYEPQQLQEMSDEIELGWDCGICLETAEDPCVTRCGHLYCQSHLNHWLSTHPSCPVCKTLCTPAQDVVPIFSRGRTSPAPSSIPSSPTSLMSSDRAAYHDLHLGPLTPQSLSGSPTPPVDWQSEWPDMTTSDRIMSDYDIMHEEPVPATPPLPRLTPASSYSPLQAHPHPLTSSYILAHYLGIALRIVGVGILLGVLLR